MTLLFEDIPDDVWIDIFENVDDPAQLAILVRTCHRFRSLASNLLLRDLRWSKMESTYRNLQAWRGVYEAVTMLPRKLTVGIPFDFSAFRGYWTIPELTPEMKLYDSIYAQIPLFSNLREIVFDSTIVSYHTYTVLAMIPTLRSLEINNCSLFRLPSFWENLNKVMDANTPTVNGTNMTPLFPFRTLPITHLSLHKLIVPAENDFNENHPLHLITAQNLQSLSITWAGGVSVTYAMRRWQLLSLQHLDVSMPLLTRDLIDSLVSFVGHCPLGLRIKLYIERHNLSEQQITAVHFPLKGVYSYKGPLAIAAFSVSTGTLSATSPRTSERDSPEHTLEDVTMNEPLELGGLLDGLERLPECVRNLEVQVRTWDVELLFAIKHLFPKIRKLVVFFGRGKFAEDFFVTIGANILFELPHIHTLKLISDKQCLVTNRHPQIHTMPAPPAPPPQPLIPPPNLQQMHANHLYQYQMQQYNMHVNVQLQGTTTAQQQHANGSASGNVNAAQQAVHYLSDTDEEDIDYYYDDQEDSAAAEVGAEPTPSGSRRRSFGFSSPSGSGSTSTSTNNNININSGSSSSSSSHPSSISSHPYPYTHTNPNAAARARRRQTTIGDGPLRQGDLEDYLIGWNRYCRSLRHVQLHPEMWWERRYEGDRWAERFGGGGE